MRIKEQALSGHLQDGLLPVYLVTGEETLIVEECCDAIIHAARDAGYTERSVHHADGNFKWAELNHDTASMSLFGERKILDVRAPAKKFDRDASEILRAWVTDHGSSGAAETIMLLRTERLDANKKKSAWFKDIDKVGGVIEIWPMPHSELPRWLSARLKQHGLEVQADALNYLSARVEGNLLSAVQEIHKLKLMDLEQPIALDAMVGCLEDTSRYNSFDLLDAVMTGQVDKVVHILSVLREEGISEFATMGALTAQIRNRENVRGLPSRVKMVQGFMRRIHDPDLVLAECAVIDQQIKGQLSGSGQLSLKRLMLRLAGARSISLPSEDQALFCE